MWRKGSQLNNNINNGRINLVVAIIFLMGASTIYKLYDLQVENYDLYSALASSQHKVSSELEPTRGRIYIGDYSGSESSLYPIATNKEFASVFVIPKDIVDSEDVATKLYIVFNKAKVEEEVDEYLEAEEARELENELKFVASLGLPNDIKISKEQEVRNRYEARKYDKAALEFKAMKREAEIKLRHDEIIDEYLVKLKKKNDPYEPINKKVDEETLKYLYALLLSTEVNSISPDELILKEGKMYLVTGGEEKLAEPAGVSHTMLLYRYYPENTVGAHFLGFVSPAGDEPRGNYGLEGFFDEELFGQYGSIKSERGANRQVIIVNDREYLKPIDGDELVLTIDRSIQFMVCQKLREAALKYGADGVSVVIMEPSTGAILAMCSWPTFDPNNYKEVEDIIVYNNPVIFDQYEPGSVFKTITMAAALDQEKITPETTYVDEGQVMVKGWPKPIKNSDYDSRGGHGEVNMNYVLEESLNTGAIFVMQQLGPDIFARYVRDFGFGEKTGIELETESPGDINNLLADKVQEIYAATASFGQGLSVTALQMITAYSAIANGGILMKPYMVRAIIHSDNSRELIKPRQIKRVISLRAATLLSGMLVNVIESGHAKLAGVKGYWVGGKTGTAQVASSVRRGYSSKTIHTFVGYAPAEEPKFVMLVKLDNPKNVRYSASSAAPLFGEMAEYLLQYYQVAKERK